MLLFAAAKLFAALPPPNDNFADRIALSGSPISFTGRLDGATSETGEVYSPGPYAPFATIWWSWTAIETTPVAIEVLGVASNQNSYAAFTVWNPANLAGGFPTNGGPFETSAKMLFLPEPYRPSIVFTGYAGVTYQFQLAGEWGSNYVLLLEPVRNPIILEQPKSVTISEAACAMLTVQTISAKPLQYQWRKNDVDISNAIAPVFCITNATLADAGDYFVVVSNGTGVSTSQIAQVSVTQTEALPRLFFLSSASNRFAFSLAGEAGRCYGIQSTTNFLYWGEEANFSFNQNVNFGRRFTSIVFASNATISLTIPANTRAKFLRASPYVPSNEICNLNLRRINFGKLVWARENKMSSTQTPQPGEIYATLGTTAAEIKCPLGGWYWPEPVGYLPTCSLTNHLLQQPR